MKILLLLAVLPFLLMNVGAQIQECRLVRSLQKLYLRFMRDANPELIWNDNMSNEALQELTTPGSVMKLGAPYIALNGTRAFDKKDKRSMWEKVHRTLGRFVRYYRTVRGLKEGVNFGCNGVYTAEAEGDVLTILCFFLPDLRN